MEQQKDKNRKDQNTGTLIYQLTESSREKILRHFPPRFSRVIADHITYQSDMPLDASLPPQPRSVCVVGYAADEALEAVVAEIDGTTQRRDGGTYHITLSLEPELRKAQDSNELLEGGWESREALELEVITAKNR